MRACSISPRSVSASIRLSLYGKPSLTGEHAPFVMARLVADGPGRWYLSRHCAASSLVICTDADRLPDNVAKFLWAPDGIWRRASLEKQTRLRDEEMEVVLGTIRAYPIDVLRLSAKNFWRSAPELRPVELCCGPVDPHDVRGGPASRA